MVVAFLFTIFENSTKVLLPHSITIYNNASLTPNTSTAAASHFAYESVTFSTIAQKMGSVYLIIEGIPAGLENPAYRFCEICHSIPQDFVVSSVER